MRVPTRERSIRTTRGADQSARPADLVERAFSAPAPNRRWVADLTYAWTIAGFCYTAFIVDVFSRRIVGWRTAASLRTNLALDALEMAIFTRAHELAGLINHDDRGVQDLAIRYTERLAEAGIVNSVGSKGDSYDNALAETVNGLHKTELIRRRKSWRSTEEVELATAAWVHWCNESRLQSTGMLGFVVKHGQGVLIQCRGSSLNANARWLRMTARERTRKREPWLPGGKSRERRSVV